MTEERYVRAVQTRTVPKLGGVLRTDAITKHDLHKTRILDRLFDMRSIARIG
jgi:hypothetical protein